MKMKICSAYRQFLSGIAEASPHVPQKGFDVKNIIVNNHMAKSLVRLKGLQIFLP